MNSLNDPVDFPDEPGEPDAADLSDPPAGREGSLFADDHGTLPLDTRRALVQLLLGPMVDGRRQPRLWQVVLRDEAALRQHLHNLFLALVVDHDQKVAFTRQVIADGLEAPILLRRMSLTFLESALMLFLRQCLTQADAHGERAVVSRTEMGEHLRVYERDRNVDQVRFDRQMEKAIEKAKRLGLLQGLRGGEGRFEVSPTLKLLFPAEDILALTETYRTLIDGGHAGAGDADGGDGEEDSGAEEGA